MSKRKTVSSDSLAAVKWQQDPKQMVVLKSTDSHLFAVDRNCALISQFCRDYLTSYDALMFDEAEEVELKEFQGIRKGKEREFDPCVTFVDFYGDTQELVNIPVSYLKEEYQRHMETTQFSMGNNSVNDRPKSESGRRASNVKDKTLYASPSLLATVELDGRMMYPLIIVPLSQDLLNDAIDFMYMKYSADTNPEKRTPATLDRFREKNAFRLMACSVTLGL